MNQEELISYLKLMGVPTAEYNSSVYRLTPLVRIHVGVQVSIYCSRRYSTVAVDRYTYPLTEQSILNSVKRINTELAQLGVLHEPE